MTNPLRILLVEDEAILAMGLEALLVSEGHEVVGWATSRREAEPFIRDGRFDAAFVDLHLTDGMTGLEIARALSQQDNVLVMLMTANARKVPDDFAGAAGLIAKPYTMQGVRAALSYLGKGFFDPPPPDAMPRSITLAPRYAARWAH